MAVIVQSLIAADAAGVIFTADPVSGDDNCIIIEACKGLGDTLVSGRVTPDRVVLAKSGLKAISRSTLVPCISDETVRKLAALSIKAETGLGCPQDIEWAILQERIYLLQSRPVTTATKAKSFENKQIWCSFAAREVIPDVVTPISFQMLQFITGGAFKTLFDVLCINEVKIPPYDLVAGRVYFNISLWAAVIRHFGIMRKMDMQEFAGSEPEMKLLLERFKKIPTEDLPKTRHNRIKFILKLPLLIAGMLRNNRRKSQVLLANAARINAIWASIDISGVSAERLADYLTRAVTDMYGRIINGFDFVCLIHWMSYFPLLERVCRKWFPDEQSCTGRLLAGVGNMVDAEAGLDLWRLTVKINESPALKELVQSNACWDVVSEKLVKSSAGEDLLTGWNRFMKTHGHHCRGELELYNPRWSEMPDYVLNVLRGYLNSMDKTSLLENRRRVVEQREHLAEKCRRKLKNPFKRAIFNYLLSRAQYGSVFRENLKSELIKVIASVRRILLELGKKLAAGSAIADYNDVFFLKFDEIGLLARGQTLADIKQVIAARRAEYKKWEAVTPPCLIVGRFDPERYVPAEVNADVLRLKGLAVSPGMVTGKARVILRADENQQVQAGEILVAPFTDPGWTPYFIPAGGIVMDQGGLLSHGAIIAREYGIPAVVNVGNATRIIKTGQTIEVDGDKGAVRILK